MNAARAYLAAKLAALPVAQLQEISLRLALGTTTEDILVATMAERELEARMTEADFLAHMAAVDALFDAVA